MRIPAPAAAAIAKADTLADFHPRTFGVVLLAAGLVLLLGI